MPQCEQKKKKMKNEKEKIMNDVEMIRKIQRIERGNENDTAAERKNKRGKERQYIVVHREDDKDQNKTKKTRE